jgi:hypothetical protein
MNPYRVPNKSGAKVTPSKAIDRDTPGAKIAKGGDLRSRPGSKGGGSKKY